MLNGKDTKNAIPSGVRKFAGYMFKSLGAMMLWIVIALMARVKFAPGAYGFKENINELPIGILIFLLILLPVVWLLVEFVGVCFLELRIRMLESSAPKVARWLTEFPCAVWAVALRVWDWFLGKIGKWRFDDKYKKRVGEDCHQLHTQTGLLHATANFSLEEVYTELNMAAGQYSEINSGLMDSEIKGRENIYDFLRVQKPGSVLAILGRPGGGKTTLIRHLAFLYANNKQGRYRLRRKIPVVIELRRIAEMFSDKPGVIWKMPTLIQVMQFYWKQQSSLGGLIDRAPKNWLKHNLGSGRLIIMVDGLDEISHHVDTLGSISETPRQRVSKWLETEMQKEGQRDCLFVVTSRPGGFAEAPLKKRVMIVEVQPMTLDQSQRFIYSFQLGCQKKDHPTLSKKILRLKAMGATNKLQQEFAGRHHLADMRVNPLLLHMVCLVHHLRGRLPSDRSDLYRETCDVLLNRDLRAPGIQERMRPEDKLAALRPLANYFMRSESPEAKSSIELLQAIDPVFETLDFPSKNFFDFVAKDSGLLQEVEKDRWDFAHKTFYEYLASEHWEKHPPAKDELLDWVKRDWWRVALLFYSAKSSDSPVISAALDGESPQSWSLAFECLAAGHRLNSHERERANSKLNSALSNPKDKNSFNPAAQALLDLKMREEELASSDGKILKRKSYITQAEYQLFLHSLDEKMSSYMVPLEWKEVTFKGDPHAPVKGVNSFQIRQFIRWLTEKQKSVWDLPDLNSNIELPDGSWAVDGVTGILKVSDSANSINSLINSWLVRVHLDEPSYDCSQLLAEFVPKNEEGRFRIAAIFARLRRDMRFDDAHLLFSRSSDLVEWGVGINMHLTFCVLNGTVSDPSIIGEFGGAGFNIGDILYLRNREKLNDGKLIDGFRDISIAVGELFDGEFDARILSFGKDVTFKEATSIDRFRWMASKLSKALGYGRLYEALKVGNDADIFTLKSEMRVLEVDLAAMTEYRKFPYRVVWYLVNILITRENGIEHRKWWVDYGCFLIESIWGRMDSESRYILNYNRTQLRLSKSRIDGEIEPWEKIVLVRNI